MSALVIHATMAALPARSRPIAGVAIAPPWKLRGNVRAARQTAKRTESALPCGEDRLVGDIGKFLID